MLHDVHTCRHLREQYSLAAQLYCNQEALLPGHTVPLMLLLSLQLHGTAAPLSLLQDLQLSVTATTREGGPVTQVSTIGPNLIVRVPCSLSYDVHDV